MKKTFIFTLLKRCSHFLKKHKRINTLINKTNSNFKNIEKINLGNANFVYKFKNCNVIPSSNYYFDKNGKIIKQSIDHLARDKQILDTNKKIDLKGNILNLCYLNHNNYYHFTIDILFKLYVFKKLKIKNYKIIFLKNEFNSYRKDLFLFFFPKERKNLYFVDLNTKIFCESAFHIPTNFEYNFSRYNNYINFLKQKISSSKKIKTTKKKLKIYISRKITNYRNFENEKKLITFLKKRGFVILQLEKESLIGQFKLFRNSKIVLACHGSALTNIIACKKNTKIIEIHSEYITDNYSKLARILSINNYFNYSMRKDDPFLHFYENTFTKNKNKIITQENLKDLEFLINIK